MGYKFPTQTVDKLQKEYDAIVVGSGGTGLAAAIQAQQYGLNVAILEKNGFLGGNTMRASSGMNAAESIVQARLGVNDSMQKFYDETLKGGGYMNDREMLHYFVEHAPLAIAWLEDLGIKVDEERNSIKAEIGKISSDDSSTLVYVIPTNEELVIARDTLRLVTNR